MLATIIALLTALALVIKVYRDVTVSKKEKKAKREEESPIYIPTQQEITKYTSQPSSRELRDYISKLSIAILGVLGLASTKTSDAKVARVQVRPLTTDMNTYLMKGCSAIGDIVDQSGVPLDAIGRYTGIRKGKLIRLLKSSEYAMDLPRLSQEKILAALYEIGGYRVNRYIAFPWQTSDETFIMSDTEANAFRLAQEEEFYSRLIPGKCIHYWND